VKDNLEMIEKGIHYVTNNIFIMYLKYTTNRFIKQSIILIQVPLSVKEIDFILTSLKLKEIFAPVYF